MNGSVQKGCIILIFLSVFTVFSAYRVYEQRSLQSESLARLSLLSPSVAKVAALEFKGVMADLLLLKTMTFLGEHILGATNPSKQEWEQVKRMLDVVTHLDERFLDPYLLAESMLVWQAGMIKEGNSLIEKAAKVRTDDFRPYFMLWFNAYYFQHDNELAEKYMQLAALKPNAPGYLTGLAARMSLYGGRTESGILFLETMLREIPPTGSMYGYIEKRLVALKDIYFLEIAVKKFQDKMGKPPKTLQDLIDQNIIAEIPTDPYGGVFYLTPKGKVYTSSKLIEKKEN